MRLRLLSAPLDVLALRAPVGRVVDVGCGHGALSALLAADPLRSVVAIDPDPHKIAWAQRALTSLPNVRLQVATIEELARAEPASFDAVLVADVLYLLPLAQWPRFLAAARSLLRPGGVLLLKEAEASRSWKYWKCWLQEQVMVRLFRKTHSSGGLGFRPRAELSTLVEQAGLSLLEVADVSRGYSTPHVLWVARYAGAAP